MIQFSLNIRCHYTKAIIFIAVFFLWFGITAQQVNASNLSTKQVVQNVQKFYRDTKSVQSSFEQIFENKTFRKTSKSHGRVYIAKPEKIRWDYYERKYDMVQHHKSFISNGKTLWMVYHTDRRAIERDIKQENISVAVTLLYGKGNLSKEFIIHSDNGTYGRKEDHVLLLKPKKPNAQYQKVWLVIDTKDFHVRETIVLDASGNTNHFLFTNVVRNRPMKQEWFVFNPKALGGYTITTMTDTKK